MLSQAALPAPVAAEPWSEPATGNDVSAFVQATAGGQRLHLMVENVHCGGCVRKIERALQALDGVTEARLNLTTRRLVVGWQGAPAFGNQIVQLVAGLGYPAFPFDPGQLGAKDAAAERQLLRAMAVAGFAAANVMLLSVSVWAGDFATMGPATRALLHWFSALIVLPAVVYAGRPFFESAARALAAGRTNMDVPISLGITLACGMSLFETIRGGQHAYFDSAIMLLFFLLLGRYLDRRARGQARRAAERLLTLEQTAVTVLDDQGHARTVKVADVARGMTVLVAAGERIGADGKVLAGRSELDTSLITGETLPRAVAVGEQVFAGTLNLGAPITLEVSATGEGTLLAEIVRLMELAEQRRAAYVVLADRVARLYAPVVHGLALLTFLGWTLLFGLAWQVALLYAIAVLIITCPCALGLAVPAVQVLASGRLLARGTLLKSATALERLAQVDTVVFDKTGTLTEGRPTLQPDPARSPELLAQAAALAGASKHPLCRALRRAAPDVPVAKDVVEVPGSGLQLATDAGEIRLGNRRFCGIDAPNGAVGLELWLVLPSGAQARFAFDDALRPDAAEVVAALKAQGLAVELLSGDRTATVTALAGQLDIVERRAECSPTDKLARLETLAKAGHRVLMVGDGLNDAAALAAAHVSISPASAVDISRTAADAVFQGDRLQPVVELLAVAGRSQRLIRQNFGLALGYNLLTIPLAVAGLVTPLVAALCMSASSLLVVGNALRLGRARLPAVP